MQGSKTGPAFWVGLLFALIGVGLLCFWYFSQPGLPGVMDHQHSYVQVAELGPDGSFSKQATELVPDGDYMPMDANGLIQDPELKAKLLSGDYFINKNGFVVHQTDGPITTEAKMKSDIIETCAEVALNIGLMSFTFWGIKKSMTDRSTPKIIMRVFFFMIMIIGIKCIMYGAADHELRSKWFVVGLGLIGSVLVFEIFDTLTRKTHAPSALVGLEGLQGGQPEATCPTQHLDLIPLSAARPRQPAREDRRADETGRRSTSNSNAINEITGNGSTRDPGPSAPQPPPSYSVPSRSDEGAGSETGGQSTSNANGREVVPTAPPGPDWWFSGGQSTSNANETAARPPAQVPGSHQTTREGEPEPVTGRRRLVVLDRLLEEILLKSK